MEILERPYSFFVLLRTGWICQNQSCTCFETAALGMKRCKKCSGTAVLSCRLLTERSSGASEMCGAANTGEVSVRRAETLRALQGGFLCRRLDELCLQRPHVLCAAWLVLETWVFRLRLIRSSFSVFCLCQYLPPLPTVLQSVLLPPAVHQALLYWFL